MTNSVQKTFPQLLIEGAKEDPDRLCLVLPKESSTYGEIFREALNIAKSLKCFGIAKGDPVGILMANSVRYVESLFAVSLLGALPVLYNGRFKSREISHVTKDSGIKIILTSDKADEFTNYAELLSKAIPGIEELADSKKALELDDYPDLERIVLFGEKERIGFQSEQYFLNKGHDLNEQDILSTADNIELSDLAIMFYTSGTTAMPKGCPLTHTVLLHAGIVGGKDRLCLETNDVVWGPLPMFHTAFTQPFCGTLSVQGTFISMDHFDPKLGLEIIKEHQPDVMFPAFGQLTLDLLNLKEYTEEDCHHYSKSF